MSFDISIVLIIGVSLLAISFAGYVVFLFNNYVSLKNLIKKSQANIDVLLKQRFEELPKLISSVKGYMNYEAQILSDLTNQRNQIMNQGMNNKAAANSQIIAVLKTVFALAENYPELKANQNFLQLQQRISSIETEISQRRIFYNETVNNYNIWIKSFPNSVLAAMLKAKKMDVFDTIDKKDIEVKL